MGGEVVDLSVTEAAEALGTSPQTVRTLLRKGDLPGRKQPWGSRYVWVASRSGVDAFLAEYGRLDGHRRQHAPVAPAPPPDPPDGRPFALRPRGRATVAVVVLGVPMLVVYAVARVLPDALWFDEVGQGDVLRRTLVARVECWVAVVAVATAFVGVNLAVAMRRTHVARSPAVAATAAAALVTGSIVGSSADSHWQTYLLWRHRQDFGVTDPIHGKDVGFFVFTLPMERLVSGLLLWVVVLAAGYVLLVYLARGQVGLRPPRATFGAQVHLAVLAAALLLVVAWRLRIEQYLLELNQPSVTAGRPFAGATYADLHARSPGLSVLTWLAVLLAVLCVCGPVFARGRSPRRAWLLVGVPGALLVVGTAVVATAFPALIQQYDVDPNPLVREQPYVEHSIAATRAGLGLDDIAVEPYEPGGGFTAADYPAIRQRLANVLVWDTSMLEARMRQLVTDTPYYDPEAATLDTVRAHGQRHLTVVSARELDPSLVGAGTDGWISNRLAYTHGLGLIRFSGTAIEPGRGPRELPSDRGVTEPRIYFGNLAAVPRSGGGGSPWVLVNTRRPEVDLPASGGEPPRPYHYDGPGGIELLNWARRAAFALELGSKELLLSDDITPGSRILLHRDVHDRLHTLAPFIQWDSEAVPLTSKGHIVFVVDGYTTSASYPYAERVDLGGSRVSYARAPVRATVDAFTGRTELYLTDDSEPIARAWSEAFPTLFRPGEEMPEELQERLRYPGDLFDAQAAAYETFHTTRPDVFVSGSDAWSRPIALAGPVEVAGDVDFDESDEDDLRLTMQPAYAFSPPPGQTDPRLVLATYYTPQRGQNLVASLRGWIDDGGRAHLATRSLPRDPVTLGPAQMSRLVFATPRVRNLLGLRNLEIRDLDKSSLDAVRLGQPHLVILPGGVIQVQSLYEGSRGPGAARLLGVTAFVNGRAGLGPDLDSALRQALNEPPSVDVLPPAAPVTIGRPVDIAFRVQNARREVVILASPSGRTTDRLALANGRGSVRWTPSEPGRTRVRVEVRGLDGTSVVDHAAFEVLGNPPTLRLVDRPRRAVAGEPVRLVFAVRDAIAESARVSTRTGVVLLRDYRIRDGRGVVQWTPQAPGEALLDVRVRGLQGQETHRVLRIDVAPRRATPAVPTVTLLEAPSLVTIGETSEVAFRAEDCRTAVARIGGPNGGDQVWRFPCPARRATFAWRPTEPGSYRLTATARGGGTTVEATTHLRAEPAE